MTKTIQKQKRRESRKYIFNNIDFEWNAEDISNGVDWQHFEDRHLIILHLNGRMERLETELEGQSTSFGPPNAGEVWVVPAGQRYASAARGEQVTYGVIRLDPKLVDRLSIPQDIAARQGVFDPFALHVSKRLMEAIGDEDDISNMLAASLSESLSLHLAKTYGLKRQPILSTILSESEIRVLREYVFDNLSEALTIDVLAALVRLPAHQFLAGFRQAFDTTPAQYVISQRLRRAQWLLAHTQLCITEIAADTGFSTHSHLCNSFAKRFSCTPSEFRRQSREY